MMGDVIENEVFLIDSVDERRLEAGSWNIDPALHIYLSVFVSIDCV